jgi:2-C-methyl-D-erythritol 2,4-cyclodiphosphate synthase
VFRIGQGIDIHRFASGRKLVIGGVIIPFENGLDGHSDADVLVHAIMDALLGAVAGGDIGARFPNDDPTYKNADSLDLLSDLYADKIFSGWKIGNIDSTIIAQAPKMSPFIPQMRKNISEVLGVDLDSVCIKATTSEMLGFCGRGEGIVAMANIILIRNNQRGDSHEENISRVRSGGFKRKSNNWQNRGWENRNRGSSSFPKRSGGNERGASMGHSRDIFGAENRSSQGSENRKKHFGNWNRHVGR